MPTSTPVRSSCQLRLSAVLLGVIALLSSLPSAHAQAPSAKPPVAAVQRYDLPPAPLVDTLRAIARIGGKRIDVDQESVAGVSSGAVSGDLTVEQAVARALAGTPLSVTEREGGGLWVALATRPTTVLIVAKRDQAETSFKADRSDTATRSGTHLLDLPSSMTIITSKVLETQQALSVQDALANVSGVTFEESPHGRPSLTIRGFASTTTAVNGVNDMSAALTNVFAVERIEVLKGPQAILAGADSLGGTANVVTKKPQADPIRTLLLQYGTHGDVTLAGDLAGALSEDKKLTYRLIASTAKARDSAGGFDGRADDSFMPQLRWKDGSTDLILGLSYGKQFGSLGKYTFARRDGAIMPAPEMRLGRPEDGFDSEQRRAFYQLEQKITPDVTLVSRLQHSTSDLHIHLRAAAGLKYDAGAAPDTPNGRVDFFSSRTVLDDRSTSGDHYLRIEGGTGPIQHKLSVGIGHTKFESTQSGWSSDFVPNVQVYPADPSFVFAPVDVRSSTPSTIFAAKSGQVGAFAQDLISWGDWNLLVNLRRTRYSTESDSTFSFGGPPETFAVPKETVWATTPGIGLVYNVSSVTSIYASYAEGFVPQFSQVCGGGMVPPQLSRNREVGAKFDLLDSRLSLTTAAFELAQSNSLQFDRVNGCFNVRDAQITRGLEFDLQGQIAPGWSAVMNYAHSKLKDVGDSTRIFTGQPKHKLSLWTIYELQGPDWRGLGFGAGLTASSRANGDFRSRFAFTTPGQAQVDLSAFYSIGKWSSTLGVKNVFDKVLYSTAANNTYVPLKEGRSFMLTVKRDFN